MREKAEEIMESTEQETKINRNLEIVPIDSVHEDPVNANTHNERSMEAITNSLRLFGQQKPIAVDKTGKVIAGNGTHRAAKKLGWKEISIVRFNGGEKEAEAYAIADNRTAQFAKWDAMNLFTKMEFIKDQFPNMSELGFTDAEWQDLTNASTQHPDDAAMLDKLKVTIDEPMTKVKEGDKYLLGKRHVLLVLSPITAVERWLPHLTPNMLFCPFAGPYIALTERAEFNDLFILQPEPYVAGHLLDCYKQINGEESVELVAQ